MNPNDNNLSNQNTSQDLNGIQPVNPTPVPEPVNSISPLASKDETPMSLEKVEVTPTESVIPVTSEVASVSNVATENSNIEPTQTPASVETQPVTSIFSQDLNTQTQTSNSLIQDTNSLYNYQTNAINPNASVNLNDFRIDETNKPISEISNLESTTQQPIITTEQTTKTLNEPEIKINEIANGTNNSPSPVSTQPFVPDTQPISTINTPNPSASNTIVVAVLGVVLAVGLIAGGYFVFFKKPATGNTQETLIATEFKTEKIMVTQNSETKVLSEEEYKTTIKSFVDRYNNNIRNSKVKLAVPNLTIEQKLEVYMNYSTEILNIYTEIQNLKVPTSFKNSHDKLTLSLYAINSLYDNLIIEAKNKTLTSATQTQLYESITKAESVASVAFNEIVNSQ